MCVRSHDVARLLKSRWEGFWASTLKWKFLAELIVCVLQPIPVRNFTFAGKTWLRHFGLLMFLRVYIAARVLRDKSNIYRNRHRAKDLGLRLHVGFMSSLRAELRRRPLFWMSWAISGTVVVFTYVVFVMERFARYNGSDGNIITWNDSMWFVVATLTTVGASRGCAALATLWTHSSLGCMVVAQGTAM